MIKAGVNPNETLIVEDSHIGRKGAISSGGSWAGSSVDWGHGPFIVNRMSIGSGSGGLPTNLNFYHASNSSSHLWELDLPDYYNCSLAQGNNGQVISSAPRRLTNNQIYAINEIRANQQVTKDWIRSPSSTDIFAKIPIVKPQSYYTGELYIDATTTLQVNERVYFGPVSIKRLKVRLLDDAGRILNLNGMDWSFTLQVTSMYQY